MGKRLRGGERNNLTQEEIAADLGTGPWLSIALKHCQDLYVVDFDTHELTGCSLHEYCTALDTARTETNKGQHHYLYITDIPADVATLLTGSRQQKLCAQPEFDVDLLKGNNVWEPSDRTVTGELRTVPWSDIARFFTLPSADAARPTKRARSNAGVARPTAPTTAPSAQLPDGVADWLRDNDMPVTKVYLSQHGYVCAHVECDCPFTKHSETSTNNRYVVIQPDGLELRCHSQRCCGKQVLLPDSNKPSEHENEQQVLDEINTLLAWKLSHPSHKIVIDELRQAAKDDLSVPLRFTSYRDGECVLSQKLCPKVGKQVKLTIGKEKVTAECTGVTLLQLHKEFPHKYELVCETCGQDDYYKPMIEGLGDGGFHRDDTAVHELIWKDYDECCGGLNHIAVFENDKKLCRIPHGTRCKMYITNALNDYALRMGFHKRGAVVQVRSETCPIAFETVRVGNEDMNFKLFIEQAERALPRLKETMKTSDYKRWIEWCNTTNHSEFPVLKPDRHLLAFSNVAVDITGGDMVVKSFKDVAGAVARAYNDAEFKPEYVDMPFDELLGLCPLFRKYIVTHFPEDLVERFDFKRRKGTEDWWVGKVFIAMLARLLFEVNELDKWRAMLYLLGPKNCGKSDLWKELIQRFFDKSAVYTYEKEPDKFSVQAMLGKEIAVAPDIKTKVQDAGTLQSMICGEAVATRNMHAIAESAPDWKVPQLFISNILPSSIWSNDESGALASRFLIFQFRALDGETDTTLPQRIVASELAVVFALLMRANVDLRTYVGTAPVEEWSLPYFNDVKESEERRKQHLYRFLTEPRGNIRTRNKDIWIEPDPTAVTLLSDLKKKFAAYMEFQHRDVRYKWEDQFPAECLRKAAVHHEYDAGWKIVSRENYDACKQCGKNVDEAHENTTESGDCCCKWYHEKTVLQRMGGNKPTKAWLKSQGIIVRAKTKASESPDKIRGLVIREEAFTGDADALQTLGDFVWNGNCECGRLAQRKTSQRAGVYYHCAFGCMDDARCSMRYKTADEIEPFLPIDANGTDWPRSTATSTRGGVIA